MVHIVLLFKTPFLYLKKLNNPRNKKMCVRKLAITNYKYAGDIGHDFMDVTSVKCRKCGC